MAKAADLTPLSDDQLAAIVRGHVHDGVGFTDAKLSREREKITEYYQGEEPKPFHKGNSKYVSLDTFDAVESAKTNLLETFAEGDRILKFNPQTPNDVELASEASAFVPYVVFRQNNGYNVFHDVIHDGLTARVGVAKVYWNENEIEHEEDFEGLSEAEMNVLLSDPAIELHDFELDSDDAGQPPTYSGSITRKEDLSQVVIEPVPPEEFVVDALAKSIETCRFCAHTPMLTKSEMITAGFEADKVALIGGDGMDDTYLLYSPEVIARTDGIAAVMTQGFDNDQEQTRRYRLIEAYLDLDVEGTGVVALWKVTTCGGVVLDKERVLRRPFVAYTPLRVPHTYLGANFAKNTVSTQNARTVLIRGIIDHTVITNNPRYKVLKGGLLNPRELLDARMGGLVNITRPDAVMPFEQPSMNPFVFQTIQLLDEDKEEATGISKLSQGLNKDAISSQNSYSMVSDLVQLSQQRQKIMARNFVENFLKPLWLLVYELVLENEDDGRVYEVAGQWKRISPSQWRKRTNVDLATMLGHSEMAQAAQAGFAMHSAMSQDPGLGRIYGEAQKYALLSDTMEKAGYTMIQRYLANPAQLPPPQPDPAAVQHMQLEERKVAAQEAHVKISQQKVQLEAEYKGLQQQLAQLRLQVETQLQARAQDTRDFDSASRHQIAEQELVLAKDTPMDNQGRKVIIAPNG